MNQNVYMQQNIISDLESIVHIAHLYAPKM